MKTNEILLGIAIGDAFGAGVEFQDRDWIKENVDFTQFVNVRNKIKVTPDKLNVFVDNYNEWDYTDDTEMTIGLIRALMCDEEFSEDLLINKWKEEYEKGATEKGYGRNGHGSMRWFYTGEKTIEEIRSFQRNRSNPGNAPAMRSVPLGLIDQRLINQYAEINATSTHPNISAILSSQCIARAAEYLIIKKGKPDNLIKYCASKVDLNSEYKNYLNEVDKIGSYNELSDIEYSILCGNQPIQKPYFLPGIKGVPSDSKYTTGCVLYVLKESENAFDALKKSILLGGDVDSIASITTGIMGGVSGLSSIPKSMKDNVEGQKYLSHLANEFNSYLKQ